MHTRSFFSSHISLNKHKDAHEVSLPRSNLMCASLNLRPSLPCEGEVSRRVRERVYVGVGHDIYSSDGHRCRAREEAEGRQKGRSPPRTGVGLF